MPPSRRRTGNRSRPAHQPRGVAATPALSSTERQLLQRAMDGVRPITNDRVEPHKPARPADRATGSTRAPSEADHQGNRDTVPSLPIRHADQLQCAPDNLSGVHLQWSEDGVSARTMRDLRRGLYRPQATLDLHGLTVEKASRRFGAFVKGCENEDVRVILVVHGKGFGSSAGVPVLKSNVEQWLINCAPVIAFSSAQPRDGGTGAVYVLLRGDRPITRRKRAPNRTSAR